MSSDLTFITNDERSTLANRFSDLIAEHSQAFDCLVGYFFISGFHKLQSSLNNIEKIRILIGISTDRSVANAVQKAKEQQELDFASTQKIKNSTRDVIKEELEEAESNLTIEKSLETFVDWIKSGKIEIRVYPSKNIHAKLYISTFKEGYPDKGRVVTGSSNFTAAGLENNLEFNVELKNVADYDFALASFNKLWQEGRDVTDEYVDVIKNDSPYATFTPYNLYLKFLYEYFKDELSPKAQLASSSLPEHFMDLQYQRDAVYTAKKILREYGGVFIADVVGLGKTYMTARLVKELEGRTLILAPKSLIDENNPGSWVNAVRDFNLAADVKSIGLIDKLAKRGVKGYSNIVIDEAHKFRTDTTKTYDRLKQICWGKKMILVSATPLNNAPKDILSLIKLFQPGRNSTIPNVKDLEAFFGELEKRTKHLDRKRDREKYLEVTKDVAQDIRSKVLKYLMIRRTRQEVQKYYEKDLSSQKLAFPEVAEPEPLFYQLNSEENEIFTETVRLINQEFTYARYMPMTYYEGEEAQVEGQAQQNLGKFMRILLVKRLESSFFAFKKSVDRFVKSYEQFINEVDNGYVYISSDYSNKVFELLEGDNDDIVQEMIDEEKAQKYPVADFDSKLRRDLDKDLKLLKNIKSLWNRVDRDPKLLKFIDELKSSNILKKNKLVVFTESKETADYIAKKINQDFPNEVVVFSGESSSVVREDIINNFDAKARNKEDKYRILITTEVLSEGVNLHRSNVVINYDIPWNPTRMMQRVGRINRVDTDFKKIYTFNFFPSEELNDVIKLRESAESKIQSFIEMLGNDAKLLTDGEDIKSHDLFRQLTSKETILGEEDADESELEFLQEIRSIQENDQRLFEKIKRLPKKARSAKPASTGVDSLLTYMRKGRLEKFYVATSKPPTEVDFVAAAKMLRCRPSEPGQKVGKNFYELLDKNSQAFKEATQEEPELAQATNRRDNAQKLYKFLSASQIKQYKGFTEDDDQFLRDVKQRLLDGVIAKKTIQTILKKISTIADPREILGVLHDEVPTEYLEEHSVSTSAEMSGPREVILSEYLTSR